MGAATSQARKAWGEAFWLADYPESNIDFFPIAREFKESTGSKKPLIRLVEVFRPVICCGISSYRTNRSVIYNRSKQAHRGDPRQTLAVIDWLDEQGIIETTKGYWNQDDPTLNRTSCYNGTPILAKLYPGAKTGPRQYQPPEYLVEIRDKNGDVIKGFRTAINPRAKAVAKVNQFLDKARIEINGQRVKGINYHRVFNHDMTLGGRFYHQVQTSHKDERALITIDGERTVERDFAALHIALAYALAGLDMPQGDAYTIGDYDRKVMKLVALVSLNGGSLPGIRKKLIDEGMPQWSKRAGELQDAFFTRHEAISDMVGQENIGLRLQNLDSQIAERILLEMTAKGVAVLGWHDSFIVQKSREADLVETMKAAYREIINREPPAIK